MRQSVLRIIVFIMLFVVLPTASAGAAGSDFGSRVEGGCQVPVGVYAVIDSGALKAEAVIAAIDGKRLYRDEITGNPSQASKLGIELADRLLARGGIDIMHELGLLANVSQ